jgi:hypothetical protein
MYDRSRQGGCGVVRWPDLVGFAVICLCLRNPDRWRVVGHALSDH